MHVVDITGVSFGGLTCVRKLRSDSRGEMLWKFKCVCGRVVTYRSSRVRYGKCTSCGCMRKRERTVLKDRFWAKVCVGDADECWLWKGSFQNKGYGQFFVVSHGGSGPKMALAHRVSFELEYGRLPRGVLMHSCDVPACVNPKHLVEGTQLDNIRDARTKGRVRFGEGKSQSKLTEADVWNILESKDIDAVSLATRLGVNPSVVRRIRRGKSWLHVYKAFLEENGV